MEEIITLKPVTYKIILLKDNIIVLAKMITARTGTPGKHKQTLRELILEVKAGIDARLDNIENRLTNVENRLTNVENRLTNVENRLTNVENRVTNIENRVAVLELKKSS